MDCLIRKKSLSKMKAQTWVLAKHFEGFPKDSDLVLQDEELPKLKDGDVLFEAVCLSVDPYMRVFTADLPLNSVMIGEQVSRVVESKHAECKKGDLYLAKLGWRTHTVVNMKGKDLPEMMRLPDLGGLPPALALGPLGMPGLTANLALSEKAQPKAGEVLYVNAAAGAVGSILGQIAKIKGCTVIGSAGSDKKVAWLKKNGFDHAFNYKKRKVIDALKECAPDGIDIFIDHVGAKESATIIQKHMKSGGRVVVIGVISQYNSTEEENGALLFTPILLKSLRIEGFMIFSYGPEKTEPARKELQEWIATGKVKHQMDVTEGFKNMRSAFFGLFKGENFGKAVVNV